MWNKIAILAACLCFIASASPAQEAANIRTFNEIKCKLTLPEGAEWLDHSQMPKEVKAVFEVASGLRGMLIVVPSPVTKLNAGVIQGLEDGMFADGQMELIKAEKVTFCTVPAHQMHGRLKVNGMVFLNRAFCANDYLYQYQLFGTSDLIGDAAAVGSAFSNFEFIGEPKLEPDVAAPAPEANRPEPSTYQKSLGFSALMGRVVGLILIAIVIILIVKLVMRLTRGKNE